jgi:hypothetical protein
MEDGMLKWLFGQMRSDRGGFGRREKLHLAAEIVFFKIVIHLILAAMSEEQRSEIKNGLRAFLANGLGDLSASALRDLPPEEAQLFRDSLSRSIQVLLALPPVDPQDLAAGVEGILRK